MAWGRPAHSCGERRGLSDPPPGVPSPCSQAATATLIGSRRLRPTQRTQVTEALRAFSIETVIAYTAAHEPSKAVAQGLEKCTNYLAPVALDVD